MYRDFGVSMTASRSARGGAANEAGSYFRSRVVAWAMSHGLCGQGLPLDLSSSVGAPVVVRVEADSEVDDIVVETDSGRRLFFQAKRHLNFGSKPGAPLVDSVAQWIGALQAGQLRDQDRLIVVCATCSGTVQALAHALDRRRSKHSGTPSRAEKNAIEKLHRLMQAADSGQREFMLDRCCVSPRPAPRRGRLARV